MKEPKSNEEYLTQLKQDYIASREEDEKYAEVFAVVSYEVDDLEEKENN